MNVGTLTNSELRQQHFHRRKTGVPRMGRGCSICLRERPNEWFGGGKGMRSHVCKRCRRDHSKDEIRCQLATDEVFGFLSQSNISKKNIKRLESLKELDNEEFQEIRSLVLAIAKTHPRSKKRWKAIRKNRLDLWHACFRLHLVEDWYGEIDPLDQRLWDLSEEDLIRELNLQLAACSPNHTAIATEESDLMLLSD